jgi:hypothetical protein
MKNTVIVYAVEERHIHAMQIEGVLDKSQLNLIRDAMEVSEDIDEVIGQIQHEHGFIVLEYNEGSKRESSTVEFCGHDVV